MRKGLILTAAVGCMVLTGCNKKMSDFKAEYFSTNPNPLAVVGEKVQIGRAHV